MPRMENLGRLIVRAVGKNIPTSRRARDKAFADWSGPAARQDPCGLVYGACRRRSRHRPDGICIPLRGMPCDRARPEQNRAVACRDYRNQERHSSGLQFFARYEECGHHLGRRCPRQISRKPYGGCSRNQNVRQSSQRDRSAERHRLSQYVEAMSRRRAHYRRWRTDKIARSPGPSQSQQD